MAAIKNVINTPPPCLVRADKVCEKIPVISTFASLINIIQKIALFCMGTAACIKNRYYTHLKEKSFVRCLVLLIPIIGNLLIALYDYCTYVPPLTAKKAEKKSSSSKGASRGGHRRTEGSSRGRRGTEPKAPRTREEVKAMFAETQQRCRSIDSSRMIDGLKLFEGADPKTLRSTETITYPPSPSYETQFSVSTGDTLTSVIKHKEQGKNVVGLNMANDREPGGGIRNGAHAQEEDICLKTNHIDGLDGAKKRGWYNYKNLGTLPELGGFYCPHVAVIRNEDFSFRKEIIEIDMLVAAVYNLKEGKDDLRYLQKRVNKELRNQKDTPLTLDEICNSRIYGDLTKEKIRNILRMAAHQGHDTLVLGAIGCGAFKNPPEKIALFFKEVFEEREFKGRFKEVEFAIKVVRPDDQKNVDAFRRIFRTT